MIARLSPLLLLTGCFDSDNDGLSRAEELELGLNPDDPDTDADGLLDGDELGAGTDPLNADTDGDGLIDGEELANGADPLVPDTDGDGYTDFEEVDAGSDPADASSVIYRGGWPYYAGKDDLPAQNGGDAAAEGRRFRRFAFKDQFGDKVDLFDFYNDEGKHVLIDVSAEWCPPCNDMAAWLDGESDAFFDNYVQLREAVEAGDLYWLTILSEDNSGGPATQEVVSRWYDSYPSPHVPVLADRDAEVPPYMDLRFWPTMILLGPDLKVKETSSSSSFAPPLDRAMQIYGQ
ncbi:MAG: hypothetical protein KTR31_22825 [Myxococcales bacterium]|nr:hypothetical protein [Myxococcales bacterium]